MNLLCAQVGFVPRPMTVLYHIKAGFAKSRRPSFSEEFPRAGAAAPSASTQESRTRRDSCAPAPQGRQETLTLTFAIFPLAVMTPTVQVPRLRA